MRARFARVADSLSRRGYLPAHSPWEEHMAEDITTLMRCRAIYMLGDWQTSHGARLEHAIAKKCDLQIIYENGDYA